MFTKTICDNAPECIILMLHFQSETHSRLQVSSDIPKQKTKLFRQSFVLSGSPIWKVKYDTSLCQNWYLLWVNNSCSVENMFMSKVHYVIIWYYSKFSTCLYYLVYVS